jgi:hypothetical protein
MSILLGRRGVKAIGDLAHECLTTKEERNLKPSLLP